MHIEKDDAAIKRMTWISLGLQYFSLKNLDMKVDNGAIVVTTGGFSKSHHSIDLYRIKNVSAKSSPLSGGEVILTHTDGTVDTLQYVKNANEVAGELRSRVHEERQKHGVRSRDDI